jgi:hypothetical protein
MTPDVDLMLETLERALAISILPGGGNAAAKEEASLAILFARWIRDVLDQVPSAERASYRDCRAALDEIASRLERGEANPGALILVRESRLSGVDADIAPLPELRRATRAIKEILGRVLRTLRTDGDTSVAKEIRARLFELGLREIERERAFGRPSMIDPEWRSISTLADVVVGDANPGRKTK